jgi:hypothetical protein
VVVALAIGAALLAAISSLVLLNGQVASPIRAVVRFRIPPTVVIAPRHTIVGSYGAREWAVTDHVLFREEELQELRNAINEGYWLSRSKKSSSLFDRLETLLGPPLLSSDPNRLIFSLALLEDSGRLRSLADELAQHGWLVEADGAYVKVARDPHMEISESTARSLLIETLQTQGWKAQQRGGGVEFTRARQGNVERHWYHIAITRQLAVLSPGGFDLPGSRKLLLEPGDGSGLTLSAPEHLISSTSPSGNHQTGAGKELIQLDLANPEVQDHIDIRLRGPLFQNGIGLALTELKLSTVVKALAGLVAGVILVRLKWPIELVMSRLQRKLRIPGPSEPAEQKEPKA